MTKAKGSLGEFERLAVRLASLQHTDSPSCDKVAVTIFAADHGVAEESVSAYSQSVTARMIENCAEGKAAVAIMAQSLGADLNIINVGTLSPLPALTNVTDRRIAGGTANFTRRAAMTESQLKEALAIGREAVIEAKENGAQLWIGGEMGVGNTTSATALACAFMKLPAATLVGPGAGLDNAGQIHKAAVIQKALQLYRADVQSPIKDLQYLGGFEIAALTGAYIAAAQVGLPVLVDGFISTVAAVYAHAINHNVKPWLFLSHVTSEPAHARLLEACDYQPILNLGMSLGEGTGAAAAVPLFRLACELHNKLPNKTAQLNALEPEAS